jgi:hypothetical protein
MMRKYAFLLTGSLLFYILAGCTTVRRFKSADYKGVDNGLVDVSLFNSRLSGEPEGKQERSLWTLSANAQTRMVQILDERYPGNEAFLNALAGNFNSNEVPLQDLTQKDLRMVFSIEKNRDYSKLNDGAGRFSPADRIEYLKISLEIPESYRLRFLEWNRYETEYGEIDLADVSFTRNLELSLDGSPAGADVGYDASVGRNEKQAIRQRYLKMNGNLNEYKLEIESEGTRETDLTGNVIAEISLAFAGFPEIVVVPVFSDTILNGKRVDFVALRFVDVVVPAMEEAPDTIYASLSLDYTYRHAAGGWRTYAEWDDRVEYYQGHVNKMVPLFLKKDFLPALFCIGSERGEKSCLKFRKSQGKEYMLQFRDQHEASRFLAWLQSPSRSQTDPVFIGENTLLYNGSPVTPGEIVENQLRVLTVY